MGCILPAARPGVRELLSPSTRTARPPFVLLTGSALSHLEEHGRHDAIATCAVEPKGLWGCDINVPSEGFTQQGAGAKKAGAHRRLRYAETRGGFLHGKFFQRTQDKHRAENLG